MKRFIFKHRILSAVLSVIILLAVVTAAVFSVQISGYKAALHRIPVKSVKTTYGTVTYAEKGSGSVPVLVFHGTDGGYDQALASAETFDSRFRVICPSRFGYPGSDMPKNPTPKAQADAFRQLLDKLGIDSAYLLATSAGGPPALQFALNYPQRTAGVILLSTGMPVKGKTVGSVPTAFFNDFTMWAGLTFGRPAILNMFGAGNYGSAPKTSRDSVDRLLKTMLPISEKKAGFLNDMSSNYDLGLHYGDYPLEKITAPVLVLHAKDDSLANYDDIKTAKGRIPNEKWVIYDHGGHLLFGHNVSDEINKFIFS